MLSFAVSSPLKRGSPEVHALVWGATIAILGGILAGYTGNIAILAFPAILGCLVWLVRSPQTLFLAWLLVSPIANPYLGNRVVAGITPNRVLIVALGLTLIIKGRASPTVRTALNRAEGLLIALLGAYGIGELTGYLRGAGALNNLLALWADRVLLPVIAFLLAFAFTRQYGRTYAKQLLLTLFWLGLISIILEVLRHYGGFEHALYPKGRLIIWNDVTGGRAVGEFENPAIFGPMVGLSMAIALFGIWHPSRPIYRWVAYAALSWGEIATYTRSAWLCVGLLFLLLFVLGRHKLLYIAASVSAAVALVVLLIISPPTALSGFTSRLTNDATIQTRANLNAEQVQQFQASPLWGAGSQVFDSLHFRTLRIPSGQIVQVSPPSHNSLLLMLADRGLIAFIPWALIVIYILWSSIPAYRTSDNENRKIIAVCWSMVIIFLVTANSIEVEFFPYFITVYWTLLGVLAGMCWQRHQEDIPHSSAVRPHA